MKKTFESPFNDTIKKNINDLPDHIVENINNLTSKIMIAALTNESDKSRIDPNLSLAAMQKAMSLLISQFFTQDKVPEIADRIGVAIKVAAIEYAKKDIAKEHE